MSAINLVIQDADGDKSVVSLDFLGGFAGDVDGLIEGVWGIVNPLVNGQLVGATVTIEADISSLTNAAAAAIADVQEGALFTFKTIGNFIKSIRLPTFIETFFTGSGAGKEVDVTQSAVTAFITMIEDGADDAGTPTPVSVNFTTSHGEDLQDFVKGKQSWGKNRK